MSSSFTIPREVRASEVALVKGNRPILSGLSFAVRTGQCLEITGPNGSGKTTLLKALAGIESPAGGTIDSPTENLAFAGHRDGLKADLTVAENFRFWAGIFGQQVDEHLLDRFDFAELRDCPVRALSAGQRKRLAIATVVASNQCVWLLDEPLTALDPDWSEFILDAVLGHCEAGGIAVLTTLTRSLPDSAELLDLATVAKSEQSQ